LETDAYPRSSAFISGPKIVFLQPVGLLEEDDNNGEDDDGEEDDEDEDE